jgi:hypothetical protein
MIRSTMLPNIAQLYHNSTLHCTSAILRDSRRLMLNVSDFFAHACSQFDKKRVMTNMTCGIYLISGKAYQPTNLGDNGYFGQSKDLSMRWDTHKRQLANNTHPNEHLQNYVNKYGLDNLIFRVIEEVPAAELDAAEKNYIICEIRFSRRSAR